MTVRRFVGVVRLGVGRAARADGYRLEGIDGVCIVWLHSTRTGKNTEKGCFSSCIDCYGNI